MLPNLSTLLLSLLILCKNVSTKCVQIDGNYWKPIWSADFNSKQELDEWQENGHNVQSCNIVQNVPIRDGYAFLRVNHRKYDDRDNYTGTAIRTKQAFSYGRFEIRAKMPYGDMIESTIASLGKGDTFGGSIIMAAKRETAYLVRAIHYSNRTESKAIANVSLNHLTKSFRLFGAEWSANGVRFFLDHQYSNWTNFTEYKNLSSLQYIRLQTRVEERMLANFDMLEWTCPALVVDYVRVYEPSKEHRNCKNYSEPQDKDEMRRINKLCLSMLKSQSREEKENLSHLKSSYVVCALMMLFAVGIVWATMLLCTMYNKFKRKKADFMNLDNKDKTSLSLLPKESRYTTHVRKEDQVYEDIDDVYYEIRDRGQAYARYLKLQNNEYLIIQNDRVQSNKN